MSTIPLKSHFTEEDMFTHPWLTARVDGFLDQIDIKGGARTRLENFFQNEGITFIGEFIAKSLKKHAHAPNVGMKSLQQFTDRVITPMRLVVPSTFEGLDTNPKIGLNSMLSDMLYRASEKRRELGYEPGQAVITAFSIQTPHYKKPESLNARARLLLIRTGSAEPKTPAQRLVDKRMPRKPFTP